MIIFDGKLTGISKKVYINKQLNTMGLLVLFLCSFSIPVFGYLSFLQGFVWRFLVLSIPVIAIAPLIFRLCITKKERERLNLKKVIIHNGDIVAISEKSTVSNRISKAKKVYYCGEYYEIVYPRIYFTSIFVCQKDLISKGTIEEFESIFSGKIIHK